MNGYSQYPVQGFGNHGRYTQAVASKGPRATGPKALLTLSDVRPATGPTQSPNSPEIVPVGFNTGHGAMRNNSFYQKVAPGAPSPGGTLPGGMPLASAGPRPPCQGPGCAGGAPGGPMPGMAGMELGPRFNLGRTQIRFIAPVSMKIAWQIGDPNSPGNFSPPQLQVPARYNFKQARIYRLKLTDVPNREAIEFYPTLEVYPGNTKVDAYLAHNAVPIEFAEEDFDQAQAGNYVTKVIYLPDPKFQELAIAGVETLVSTRLDPGVDPVQEAHRRGAVLAVIRLGSVDLEMPHSPELLPNGLR